MRLATISILLAACGSGGSAPPDSSTIDATPRQVVTGDKQLLVGELAEGILTGGPGDVAVIHLAAPTMHLDWNLHGHAGGDTQTITEELGVMTATYSFSPTSQADWYLLLRNKDTTPMTVQVELDLYGGMQWSDWQ